MHESRSRKALEERIEQLIELLDHLDGDTDLEATYCVEAHHFGIETPLGILQAAVDADLEDDDGREDDAGDNPEEPGGQFHYGWAEPDVIRVRRASLTRAQAGASIRPG